MAQKFLYIVQHYVPYPNSDGGIWNVIAENDDECFDLITAEDDGDWNTEYYPNLHENILKSTTFALAENVESCVVEEFTT